MTELTDQASINTPLPYGKLAPAFELQTVNGETVTRSQFRNRCALLIVFFHLSPEIDKRFEAIVQESPEFIELNVRILAIGRADCKQLAAIASKFAPAMTILADPEGKAWNAYTMQSPHTDGCAAFMLDMYGGVDAQYVCASLANLPIAKTLLEWARAAQYRCSI